MSGSAYYPISRRLPGDLGAPPPCPSPSRGEGTMEHGSSFHRHRAVTNHCRVYDAKTGVAIGVPSPLEGEGQGGGAGRRGRHDASRPTSCGALA